MSSVDIVEIDLCGVEWAEIEFPVELSEDVLKEIKPITTKESALDIAQFIIEQLHKEGRMLEDTLLAIVHSTEDNIWRFEYSIDQLNVDADKLIACGVFYVAIDGSKGELIAAWVEE